jgi:hypothetical protein
LSLPNISISNSHAALLKGTFYAGEIHDTIIIPLTNPNNSNVSAWNKDGKPVHIKTSPVIR